MVMKDPTWEAEYADQVIRADTSDIAAVVAACKGVLGSAVGSEREPVTGVTTFSERLVPAVARVAAELGLPSISEETAHLARDKFAMREAFARAGVRQPHHALASDGAEALAAAERIGFPVIIKPIIGTGSMHVRRVDDAAELARHFEGLRSASWDASAADPLHDGTRSSYREAALVEEFVDGPEISVESVVVDGETHVLGIHDKPLPTSHTFEEVYACTPTRLPADAVEVVAEATRKVHAALDIRTGATHVEFRLLASGEPVVIEAAARMGGGPIYRSVQLSTGVDLVTAALDLATGRTPDLTVRPGRAVGFWNIFPERAGKLARVVGLDEVQADPRVDEVAIYREPGEFMAVPPQTFQGHGHLIFAVDGVDELDATFEEFRAVLRLETEQ